MQTEQFNCSCDGSERILIEESEIIVLKGGVAGKR